MTLAFLALSAVISASLIGCSLVWLTVRIVHWIDDTERRHALKGWRRFARKHMYRLTMQDKLRDELLADAMLYAHHSREGEG